MGGDQRQESAYLLLVGRVEPIKNVGELLGMAQVNPPLTPLIEQIFEPLMGEADYHRRTVTAEVTPSKGKRCVDVAVVSVA